MKNLHLRAGTATGIGSLPHRQTDAAVAVALASSPELPAAPTLPARDPLEGMIPQSTFGMVGVDTRADGSIALTGALDPARPYGPDGATIEGPGDRSVRIFLRTLRERTTPIKLQLTGPVTLGLALVEAGADPDQAFGAAGAAVRDRARVLLGHARTVAPMAAPVCFIDEPGLVVLSRPDGPIRPDHALDLVSGALAAVEEFATAGLHCCGETDWRLAIGTGAQIISLPADDSVLDHAGALGEHLDRGGWVAWGAVPTAGPLGVGSDRLWRILADTWCELVRRGCDALRLREQAIITPECGLARHDPVVAEHLLAITAELAERVRRQSFGVKLSVGA